MEPFDSTFSVGILLGKMDVLLAGTGTELLASVPCVLLSVLLSSIGEELLRDCKGVLDSDKDGNTIETFVASNPFETSVDLLDGKAVWSAFPFFFEVFIWEIELLLSKVVAELFKLSPEL